MSDDTENQQGRTVIGGRHGSPTVTVAMPFSKVTSTDHELREAVAELARMVARLAACPKEERATVAKTAEELAERLIGG